MTIFSTEILIGETSGKMRKLPIGQYILGCLLDAERFHDFMFDEKSAH